MKGLFIDTDGRMSVREFSDTDTVSSIDEAVGGWFEIVHPMLLRAPYIMLVNEEGLLHNLPLNFCGSVLYGAHKNGQRIVGNIVILKEGFVDGEPDVVGLNDDELLKIGNEIINVSRGYGRWVDEKDREKET